MLYDANSLIWNNVTNKGWWQIDMQGIYIDNKCIIGCAPNSPYSKTSQLSLNKNINKNKKFNLRNKNSYYYQKVDAVPDSGTSLISTSPEHVTIIKNHINNKLREILLFYHKNNTPLPSDLIYYVCKNHWEK